MKRLVSLLIPTILVISAPATAQTRCPSVADDAARLKCFDDAAKKAAKPQNAKDDPISARAKAAVSAKLKDPGSATFGQMSRAMRPNVKGEPTDTICGTVNAKNSMGGYTGARPFLFFVKDGDAYIVDGTNPSDVSGPIYHNFCK